MSTCNRLDLESLRSWSKMPKNFLGTRPNFKVQKDVALARHLRPWELGRWGHNHSTNATHCDMFARRDSAGPLDLHFLADINCPTIPHEELISSIFGSILYINCESVRSVLQFEEASGVGNTGWGWWKCDKLTHALQMPHTVICSHDMIPLAPLDLNFLADSNCPIIPHEEWFGSILISPINNLWISEFCV